MKTPSLRLVVATATSVIFFTAAAHAKLTPEDRADIERTHAAASAYASKDPMHADWAKWVEMHYSADAKVLPPDHPVVSGREAIVEFFKSFPPVSVFKSTDLEMHGTGDVAYIRGSYEIVMNPPDSEPVKEIGKWVEVWRKRDGTWRCVMDTFNADPPAE